MVIDQPHELEKARAELDAKKSEVSLALTSFASMQDASRVREDELRRSPEDAVLERVCT